MKTISEEYSIASVIQELNRIFNLLNENFFENKLELPVIIIQSNSKKILGSCSNNRIWINKDNDKLSKYEINITAENLNMEIDEIVATLLHEMIHLYCSINNIKDTSNNSIYHNKKFKEESEKRGLIISYAKTIGWSVTKLKEETKELIKTFNVDENLFKYYKFSTFLEKSNNSRKKWKNKKIRVKSNYIEKGKTGKLLGKPIKINGTEWVPILWDNEEDPEFFKFDGIESN